MVNNNKNKKRTLIITIIIIIIINEGQALGLVIADTQRHANDAAKLVQSNYSNIQTPILTIQVFKSFFSILLLSL